MDSIGILRARINDIAQHLSPSALTEAIAALKEIESRDLRASALVGKIQGKLQDAAIKSNTGA